jgi:hypothetical protein
MWKDAVPHHGWEATMRSVRALLATAVALVAGFGLTACTRAAANTAGVWVQVSPSTIQPGSAVGIRASCGDDQNPATVTSPAFDTVTITPVNGILTATTQVPASTAPGTFDVRLLCETGSKATTTLTVLKTAAAPPPPAMGPHTGGGFLAGGGASGLSVPWLAVGAVAFAAAITVGVRSHRRARRSARL